MDQDRLIEDVKRTAEYLRAEAAELRRRVAALERELVEARKDGARLEKATEFDRAAREASKPAKPPASGWRSMASAPRDTGRHLAVVRMGSGYDLLCGEMCASGDWWRSDFGQMFDPEDLLAWAPIPDWTGEVGE